MVWGCFSGNRQGDIRCVSTTLNSIGYQEILEDNLVPFMDTGKQISSNRKMLHAIHRDQRGSGQCDITSKCYHGLPEAQI